MRSSRVTETITCDSRQALRQLRGIDRDVRRTARDLRRSLARTRRASKRTGPPPLCIDGHEYTRRRSHRR